MAPRAAINLVSVGAVRESLRAHGDHYLSRVYAEREVDDCTTASGIDAERLTAHSTLCHPSLATRLG